MTDSVQALKEEIFETLYKGSHFEDSIDEVLAKVGRYFDVRIPKIMSMLTTPLSGATTTFSRKLTTSKIFHIRILITTMILMKMVASFVTISTANRKP